MICKVDTTRCTGIVVIELIKCQLENLPNQGNLSPGVCQDDPSTALAYVVM